MLHKKFNQDMTTSFFKQKINSCETEGLFTFRIFQKFLRQCPKAIHGSTHREKIKKAVLTTVAYFKVSTPVRSQRQ